MHPGTRACVAYVVGSLVHGHRSELVYDYERNKHLTIHGLVSDSSVEVYDVDRACYLAGSAQAGQFTLYDHGQSAHVSLRIEGDQFSGYDYGSRHHFSGSAAGRTIAFYDFAENRYLNYAL
jgi:hypothetical protein